MATELLKPAPSTPAVNTPVIKFIEAQTLTPIIQMPTQGATLTQTAGPTTQPGSTPVPPANTSIKVGMYVQIAGTGGEGLRLRAGASVNDTPRLLGREAEVFQVQDGPKEADGYTWWYLVAPADSSRSGWAVSNYLAVIQNP